MIQIPLLKNCKTMVTATVVRCKIAGPMEDFQKITDQITDDRRATIIRSGSYTDDMMFPRCDPKRFLMTVEYEVGMNVYPKEEDLPPGEDVKMYRMYP